MIADERRRSAVTKIYTALKTAVQVNRMRVHIVRVFFWFLDAKFKWCRRSVRRINGSHFDFASTTISHNLLRMQLCFLTHLSSAKFTYRLLELYSK